MISWGFGLGGKIRRLSAEPERHQGGGEKP